MSLTVYELQKRIIPATRWRHIGYFRDEQEALREQRLPIGFRCVGAEWRIVPHEAVFDPDRPEKAILVETQEVPLGRTAFFT